MIEVACDISESGDLNQKIDTSREDEMARSPARSTIWSSTSKRCPACPPAIARGDLTVEGRPRSEHDTLAKAYSEMVQGLRSIVLQVRDGASQVAAGSEQVASASEESAKVSVQTSSAIDEVTSTMHEMSVNVQNVVKNTQSQASSVAETSASIDEMVASIKHVADTAKFLLDISRRSREEVQAGMDTMQKTTEGLNRTNKTIHTSSGIITALGRRADDIGKIVEVIDDLAEQTNLLALNAAIEAARAGEHGLGFAVVADEVRKLAEKSAQSTKEISELIESIQKEAREAVDNMERSTAIVEEGLTMGNDLQAALGRISAVVTEVHKFAQEIGAATSPAVERLRANRPRHFTPHGNYAGDQLFGGRASIGSGGRRPRDGKNARTRSASNLQFHRAGRRLRADVQARPRFARNHGPLCHRRKPGRGAPGNQARPATQGK